MYACVGISPMVWTSHFKGRITIYLFYFSFYTHLKKNRTSENLTFKSLVMFFPPHRPSKKSVGEE